MYYGIGNDIFKGILGGIAIGLGCIGYLMAPDRVSGAFLFSIGLLSILNLKWNLFTGVICKSLFVNKIGITYICNLIGIILMAIFYAVKAEGNLEAVKVLASKKMDAGHISRIFAGVLCEICIYIAVIGFNKMKSEIVKCLIVIVSVMVFVLCGFEHSIADMFYMLLGRPGFWSIIFVIEVTIGNLLGAVLLRGLNYPQIGGK